MTGLRCWLVAAAWLLTACAAATTTPRAADADCGFRAPTSCWTLGPRYVEPSPLPPDSTILRPPPPSLASGRDSAQSGGPP